MIRFPPTSIGLCEQDLEHHLQRILLRHDLVPELQQRHLGRSDNSHASGPTQFDSYPSSPHFCSSPGLSVSDSELEFDSVLTEKVSEADGGKESSNASSASSSGSYNTANALEDSVDGGSPSLDNVPIPSIDSQTRHSLSTASHSGQHHGLSVISRHPSVLPTCLDSVPRESRTVPTSRGRIHSQLQHTEQSLENSFTNLSLHDSAGPDSASPAAGPLSVLPLGSKGPENQRSSSFQAEQSDANREAKASSTLLEPFICSVYPGRQPTNTPDKGSSLGAGPMAKSAENIVAFQMLPSRDVEESRTSAADVNNTNASSVRQCKRKSTDAAGRESSHHYASPKRTRRSPRGESAVNRSHRTITSRNFSGTPAPAALGTQNPPPRTSRTPQPSSETGTSSLSSPVSSAALDWMTDSELSPARGKHSHSDYSEPSPKGRRIPASTTSRSGSSDSPSFGHVLAESARLREYFRDMVADLGYVDGPDDFGLDGLRRKTYG